ncbi:MAG: phosphoglucosamine mutase [Thermoplasmata archaeon]
MNLPAGIAMQRLFGTNGIRGVVNEDMNIELASGVGKAVGTFLCGKGRVVVGTDTRTSNCMLADALTAGILCTGVDVVDVGVCPSPAIQYAVKTGMGNFGVIITASHNPPQFNGIKCIDEDGTELGREKEEQIEKIYFERRFLHKPWYETGSYVENNQANTIYINGILEKCDKETIKKAKLRVLIDCSNGASCFTSPYLLEKLGCKVISLNAHPQGTFPGHASEPTPDNLKETIKITEALGMDITVVHDGDADRTIFIDEKGNYIFGDKSLALVAREIVKARNGGLVVTPVATSLCLEDAVKEHGGRVLYTRVGAPIVARAMIENDAVFGGEENGGMIFPEFQYCRDGGMAAAKMLEILAKTGRTLSELIDSLPKYAQIKTKVECPENKKDVALRKLVEYYKGEKIDTTDGVKILFEKSWVLIRPSGTEPIYRVYAEAENTEKARKLSEENRKLIEEIIRSI